MSLTEHALTNIGIVVDANDAGPAARWQSIRAILAPHYEPDTLAAADAQNGAKIIAETGMPTVGVWIMPDNSRNGYLEHFLWDMIPVEDKLWSFALETLDQLTTRELNVFSSVKRQKALLHTWLAWQSNPGQPFGTAIQSGVFNHTGKGTDSFLDWFAATFKLEP